MPQNVTVNLNVNVNAEGEIQVFGQAAPTISNKVVASFKLPTTSLYNRTDPADNSGGSIFEFWEPSDALGTRKAQRATTKTFYNELLSYFGYYLSKVFTNSLNAIEADPFNQTKYTSTPEYYTHSSFGRLALSSYAHYLFGHVAATAAITNDAGFIATMNNYENISSTDFVYNTSTSYNTQSTTNANLAKRIVDKIAKLTDSEVLNIVEQVIGQDASRAMDQDNSSLSPDVKQPLKFFNGDTIYVNINLQQPTVSVLNNETAQQGEPEATKYGSDTGDNDGSLNRNYTIEIVLENPVTYPNNINTLGFTDDTNRYGTIKIATNNQLILANSNVATGQQNVNSILFIDNTTAVIGAIGIGLTRNMTSSSAILNTGTLTGFDLNNNITYDSYYFVNPLAYIYKQSLQNSIHMATLSQYTQVSMSIPLSSSIKVSLPDMDFIVNGSSSNSTHRQISFTPIRTIPSGFRLLLLKQTAAHVGSGASYTWTAPSSLSDGTTTVTPSGTPSHIRTSQLSIEPGKGYVISIGNGYFPSPDTHNTYRIVLQSDSGTTIPNGSVRFGGSYLFGFNQDGTILMY